MQFDAQGDPLPERERTDAASSHSQPPPTHNPKSPPVTAMVMHDLLLRSQEGAEKYGDVLRPDNGRDALADAYQEALDLCQYLRQAIYERDGR